MDSFPLPSQIHYELLLQLLERKAMPAVRQGSEECRQVQELIVTLRKALALQKQIEADCQRKGQPVDYLWSLNRDEKTAIDREALA